MVDSDQYANKTNAIWKDCLQKSIYTVIENKGHGKWMCIHEEMLFPLTWNLSHD